MKLIVNTQNVEFAIKHHHPEPAVVADPELLDPQGEIARSSADDWSEESSRQARALTSSSPDSHRLFTEFRRKLASGEAISRALAKLAEALRFSGRITITLHQGKVTKTTLEESYFGGRATM